MSLTTLTLFILIFWCPPNATAQQLPCYFDEHLSYRFELDPVYRETILVNEGLMTEMMEENPQAIMNSTVYTIQVVFHVIHKGESVGSGTNVSNTLINQTLQDLNDYFRDIQNVGNDVEIEFCLAVRNPQGNSTTGINRVSGLSVSYYSSSGLAVKLNEEDVKNLSRWPNDQYLNIWIVSEITDGSLEIQGFGTLPATDPILDGVVLDYNVVGNSQYETVIVHEVAHFLNLYHTFEEGSVSTCASNVDCHYDGDKCCDTDPHKKLTSGCNENSTNDCINQVLGDLVHNHMNYFPSSCHYLFSECQVMRMRAALMMYRKGLIESLGCASSCSTSVADFTPSDITVEVGNSLYFTNTSTPSQSTYQWTVENDNYASTNLNHSFYDIGPIQICLRSTYQGCTNEYREFIEVVPPDDCTNPELPECELLYNGTFSRNNITVGSTNHFSPAIQMPHVNKVCNWINKSQTPFFCSNNTKDIFGLRTDSEGLEEGIVTVMEVPFIDGENYTITFEYYVGNSAPLHWNVSDPTLIIGLAHSNDIGEFNDDEIIKKLSGLSYDFDDSTNGNCLGMSNTIFHQKEITFNYTSDMGKHLFFLNEYTAAELDPREISNIYIRDVHIPSCLACVAVPEFEYNIETCSVSFEGENLGDEAISYQWEFGDGTGSSLQNPTHEYLFPGTFKVCLTIACSAELSFKECKEIEITEQCSNCTEISTVSATACNVEESTLNTYLASFSIEIPDGYKICPESDFFIYSDDIMINISSYEIIDVPQDNDLLNAGVVITSPLGYVFNQNGAKGFFTLCNEEDEPFCFTIVFSGEECTDCIEIETPSTATCNESLSDQDTYVYDGTLVFDVGDGSLIPCGYESSELGFIILNASKNGSIWTYNYRITVENIYFSSTEIILCFQGFDKLCVKARIIVTEPCSDLPDDCVEEWDVKPLECVGTNGNYAEFHFYHMSVPHNGYTICEGGLFGSIDGGGIVDVIYAQIQGTKLNFSVNILMPSNFNDNQVYYLRLYLCNNRGDMVCYLFPLELECAGGRYMPTYTETFNNETADLLFTAIPNPVNTSLSIHYPGFKQSELTQIMIYDLLGRPVYFKELTNRSTIVDVSKIPGGMYTILLVENNTPIKVQKLVVLR